jgi:ferredoxin-NADP reductase
VTPSWRKATCVQARTETQTARSLRLRVEDLGPVLPGQHIDIRLTADDGYQAVRSYSLSATPSGGPCGEPLADDEVEVTVEEMPDGEVSPYLVEGLEVGEDLEVRGPIGGWFVWRQSDLAPVQLIGGGSGVAPLMAMLRARAASHSLVPMRLLYSARSPESSYYRDEIDAITAVTGVSVDVLYTRSTPVPSVQLVQSAKSVQSVQSARPAGRITAADIVGRTQQPGLGPVFVCGPNGFVASVTDLLLAEGHDPAMIRTERFG